MRLGTRLVQTALGASHWLRIPTALDLVQGCRVQVLCYHGVSARDEGLGVKNYYGYNLPRAELEEQLEYLNRNCNVVDLGELRRGNGISRRRVNVMLTFDDGYENNYTNALPALRDVGASGVFGVPTDFVINRVPLWNDRVEYAAERTTLPRISFRCGGEDQEFTTVDLPGRIRLLTWGLTRGVTMDQEQREGFVDRFCDTLEVDTGPDVLFEDEDYRPLTREAVREMAEAGDAHLASHSVHHYMLNQLSEKALVSELRESKAQLEELTGRPCTTLCLPGGGKSDHVLDQARRAGYEVVFCSDPGTVPPDANLFKRITVFRSFGRAQFADAVHGPVMKLVSAARKLRTNLSPTSRP